MSDNNKVYSYQSLDGTDFYWGQTTKDMEERERQGYPNNPELTKALVLPHKTIVHYDGVSDEAADFYEREGIARTHTMVYEGGYNWQTGGRKGYAIVRRDSIPVLAIDKETQTAKGWYPTMMMAGKATGTPQQNIYEAVKLRRKSANGFYWKSANRDWYETAVDPAELFPEDREGQ